MAISLAHAADHKLSRFYSLANKATKRCITSRTRTGKPADNKKLTFVMENILKLKPRFSMKIWQNKHLAFGARKSDQVLLLLLLLITRPLPRDGGMAEDHGAPEARQLPRVWTRGRTETESRQRVSGTMSP